MEHTSEQVDLISAALVKAQASLESAIRDSQNPMFKNKYADINSCLAVAIPALTSNQITLLQILTELSDKTYLMTKLLHVSGQYITSYCPVLYSPDAKNVAQAFGSAVTYARRYSLTALIGIQQDDDDGNACVAPPVQYITASEFTILNDLFSQFPNDIKTKILEHMNKSFGSKDLRFVPQKNYLQLKTQFEQRLAALSEDNNVETV